MFKIYENNKLVSEKVGYVSMMAFLEEEFEKDKKKVFFVQETKGELEKWDWSRFNFLTKKTLEGVKKDVKEGVKNHD